jgi:D-arabinose 1-dehydrogenase-like Zn-dependent alcohol dehydrogenase
MTAALALLQEGKVKEHVTLLPFAEFPAALERCAKSQAKGRQVIDFNK